MRSSGDARPNVSLAPRLPHLGKLENLLGAETRHFAETGWAIYCWRAGGGVIGDDAPTLAY